MAIDRRRVIESTSVSVSGTTLTVVFPSITTVRNCNVLNLVIAQPIPTVPASYTVVFEINGVSFTVYTKYHNYVRGSQLRNCVVYRLGVGAGTQSLTMLTCIPCSDEVFTNFPPVTTTSVSKELEEINNDGV